MAPHAITVGSVGLEPHLMDQPIPGLDAGSAKDASHRGLGDVVFYVIGSARRCPVRAGESLRDSGAFTLSPAARRPVPMRHVVLSGRWTRSGVTRLT